jgi:hypothetical protein
MKEVLLKKLIAAQLANTFSILLEPDALLQCSQQPSPTEPEQIESSPCFASNSCKSDAHIIFHK